MASDWFQLCINIFLLLLFSGGNSVHSVPSQELDSMLAVVRARGYNLFSNAISTSDLELDLLTASANSSFTFFAPTDSSLFALAMTQSASSYTATLRYHTVPHRLSMSDFRRLPSRATIPTLLPSQYILLTRRRRGPRLGAIAVNGVTVVLPGLFNGRHIAVHGLGGILSLHSRVGMVYGFPPLSALDPRDSPPVMDRGSDDDRTVAIPINNRIIGISPVAPKISPSPGANATGILPINPPFLGPAPVPAFSPVEAREDEQNSFLQSSIPSPSDSPGVPPEISSHSTPPEISSHSTPPEISSHSTPPAISSHSTPPVYPPESENTVTPTPSLSRVSGGETPQTLEAEDNLSKYTVEDHESLDWMNFDFSDGKANQIDIEDSHPHVSKRLEF